IAQQTVERGGRFLLNRRSCVRIEIQRDPNVRVTQHLAHNLRMNALSKEKRCGRVPEVVKADPWYLSCSQKLRKPTIHHVRGINRLPVSTREDEVAVLPLVALTSSLF